MGRFITRRNRATASALIVALTAAFLVNCAPVAGAAPAQKACCAAMAHGCGRIGLEQDCCARQSLRFDSVVVAKPVVPNAPPNTDWATVILPRAEAVALLLLPVSRYSTRVHDPGIPTYLRLSVLLI